MALADDRLHEVVSELVTRPGHEKVRSLLYEVLVHGLGASSQDIEFELPMPEVRGRADALLGRTVFEFKRDLRREKTDAREELARYLSERNRATGQEFVGIATDGRDFIAYELRGQALRELGSFSPVGVGTSELLLWLEGSLALGVDLKPEPVVFVRELGRDSISYKRASAIMTDLWLEVGSHPDVALKRSLWSQYLEQVYGSHVDQGDLFFQHTYLSVVAKAVAAQVLDLGDLDPAALLTGLPFEEAGILGVVEQDFFNWPLAAPRGHRLVEGIARDLGRFRLQHVEHDVLKVLYESLIDPEQRHDLGEYYTPDWLAQGVCEEVITDPLGQRVLDPSCGSGTFLFHAVRRYMRMATNAGVAVGPAIIGCTRSVIGIDVHPVAVLIARVTYLLALGDAASQVRPEFAVPVYLGDAMQWNTTDFMGDREVLINVPSGPVLRFPFSVTRRPELFEQIVAAMLDYSERRRSAADFRTLVVGRGLTNPDVQELTATYGDLLGLVEKDRDHIWGYVARNLSRPIWLASQGEKVDVVVGNPPWLSFRYMSQDQQKTFRSDATELGLWAGGRWATHQDLSAYFFARVVELYLRPKGKIAFVMPYASLSRGQFEGFRGGVFGRRGQPPRAAVRFDAIWTFDEHVSPLFPVPSCVIFATEGIGGPMPGEVLAFRGRLPRRDASREEALAALTSSQVTISRSEPEGGSYYEARFRQGATMVPRVLWLVEVSDPSALGTASGSPIVASRRSSQEKEPWKSLSPLRGPVEHQFVRPILLGESIAPYRLLTQEAAVIPVATGSNRVMDSATAASSGYRHLARWLEVAEGHWSTEGTGRLSLIERLDYHHGLKTQFPVATVRVVYSKAGTLNAATVITDSSLLVDHTLYWAPVETLDEGHYLISILNSEAARLQFSRWQARGSWGTRHIDKVVWQLPIPAFDAGVELHRSLTHMARVASEEAASVSVAGNFIQARTSVRARLSATGIAAEIDRLVNQLLG